MMKMMKMGFSGPGNLETDEGAIENLQYLVENKTSKDAIKGMFHLYRDPKYKGLSIEEAYLKCLDNLPGGRNLKNKSS